MRSAIFWVYLLFGSSQIMCMLSKQDVTRAGELVEALGRLIDQGTSPFYTQAVNAGITLSLALLVLSTGPEGPAQKQQSAFSSKIKSFYSAMTIAQTLINAVQASKQPKTPLKSFV